MIKTILTATDGSAHARKAFELAADFAARYDATLVILHVVGHGDVPDELIHMAEVENIIEPPAADSSLPRATIPHDNSLRSEESHQIHAYIGNKQLHEAEKEAKARGVKKIKRVASEGDPASRILGAADVEKADMIVMGSRGLGNLKGMLVGSVSNKVIHLAKCTCVCAK